MLKKVSIFLILLFFIECTTAYSVTLTKNSTFGTVSIANAEGLYGYEINLDYSGTKPIVTPSYFLGGDAIYGSSAKDNILSVYGSRLDPTQLRISGSGELFNITFSGSLSLRYTLAIYADGSEEYVYYNNTQTPPVNPENPGSAGGAAGGGGLALPNAFDVSPSILEITIPQGQTKSEKIQIRNKLSSILEISSIDGANLNRFILNTVPESKIIAPQGVLDTVINFFASENDEPEIYVGKITLTGGGSSKAINTIITVKEDNPWFDIGISLNKESYAAGETVEASISIQRLRELVDSDITVTYLIRSFEGDVLVSKEENLTLGKQGLQTTVKLILPTNIESKDYVFYVAATDPAQQISATGSKVFSVGALGLNPSGSGKFFLALLVPIIIVIVIIGAVILFVNLRKKNV